MHVLDHFPGLIFLTTSRPAALDETIKSRVHLTIRLKPLTLEQILTVLKLNLDRIREEEDEQATELGCARLAILEDDILQFATEHYNSAPDGRSRWSGRQIRNAVQMAADLAHYEAVNEPRSKLELRADHFREVVKMKLESEEASEPGHSSISKREGHLPQISGDKTGRMVSSRGRGDRVVSDDIGGVEDESDASSNYEEGFQSLGQWSVVAD